jgi:hypothetical protein
MMLFNRDSAIQSASRKFCTFHKSENLVPCQPSGRRAIPSGPSTVSRSFETAPACIRPDVLAARLDNSQCSTSFWISFHKHSYGKIAAIVRTTWIPVRIRLFIRQVSHSKSRRLDTSQHGPDVRASYLEIACIKSAIRTTIPLVWTREAFIWKLLAMEVRSSGRQGITVRTRFKNRKEFQRNSREVDCIAVRLDGPRLPSGQRLGFIKPDAQLNLQPINRGP